MPKPFETDLNRLLSLIKDYQAALKATKQKTPEQIAYFGQLKIVYQGLKVALKEQDTDTCSIKRVNLLRPVVITDSNNNQIRSSFSPKVKIVLQIFTTQKDCVFVDETIDITYQKGGKKSILIQEVIDANQQAIFFLNFEKKENNIAFISVEGLQAPRITYTYQPSLKLDTSENVEKTKRAFDPKVMRKDFQEIITDLLPEAKMETVPNASWKKLLDFDSIYPIIENDQIDPLPDLATLSDKELSSKNIELGAHIHPFAILLNKLQKTLQTFKSLTYNYQGSDHADLFDKEYETSIANTEALIIALKEKIDAYTLIRHAIGREENLRKIPENVRTLYQQALLVLNQQIPLVATLTKRVHSYPSLDLEYAAWSTEVETTSKTAKESIQALKKALDPLNTAVEVLKAEGYSNWEYKRWKAGAFRQLKKEYELVQFDANKLLESDGPLQNKIKVLAANDGYLEFLDNKSENNFSDAEEKLFLKNIPASYQLRHETPLDEAGEKLPPFEDGAQTEDIEQGQVSDCYLLAAMANLAQPDTAHLLEEMIVEKEEKGKKIYVVTLYQEGIPVEVEVDGRFMTLTAPDEENFKNPKKHLGAAPKEDIWVPIIEKAYAKLMAKGDYTLIENNTPQNAMKALLGNKVDIPLSFLVDEHGRLINEGEGTSITNPLELASIGLQQLKQLLLSAQEKGYKMNLSSPNSYKGVEELNHNHVLNIGNGNYISFDHTYTITAIEGDMASVFNPHGKASKLGTFFDG
ncbi:MAG: Unknown protein, partial [uncultured Aureispira sp.]